MEEPKAMPPAGLSEAFEIQLPNWLRQRLGSLSGRYESLTDRAGLAIELSDLNVTHATGGPFGAAVFHAETGELASVGVNLVTHAALSVAHAEVVAIALAQKRAGRYDLSAGDLPAHQLVTSVEPCSMCMGAIHWSGLASVVCCARDEDARRVGFDEGHKPADWPSLFRSAGIEVTTDVDRQRAVEVLERYARDSGVIYNPNVRSRRHQEPAS